MAGFAGGSIDFSRLNYLFRLFFTLGAEQIKDKEDQNSDIQDRNGPGPQGVTVKQDFDQVNQTSAHCRDHNPE
jgi:hypothetical protein